jgi:hypothetical protein
MSFFRRTLLALFLILPVAGISLEPPVQVQQGLGFRTWMAPKAAKLWRLERLMYELRLTDPQLRDRAIEELGFLKVRTGRLLALPEFQEPWKSEQTQLSFNNRKLMVLTVPHVARLKWAAAVFVQEGMDQSYWKPVQLFEFDTDPVPGIQIQYPDILSDGMKEMAVRHLVKDDVYGNREVVSIFKWDERGPDARLQLTWQETDQQYRAGKMQGKPAWIAQKLKFGNQRIERTVTLKTYANTQEGEFSRYQNMSPLKTESWSERFSWNPLQFTFYDPQTELEKLATHKSELIRREAARRLGSLLSTSHPQLVKAVTKDKSAYVRIQAALALSEIGDKGPLPVLEKAAENTNEDDTVREAIRKAADHLESLPGPKHKHARHHKKKEVAAAPAGQVSMPMSEPAAVSPAAGAAAPESSTAGAAPVLSAPAPDASAPPVGSGQAMPVSGAAK